MRYLFTILILFIVTSIHAQTLTREQAIGYADKLYEVEILSEKGKQRLIAEINKQQQPPSASSILTFCAEALKQEFFYRSGGQLMKKSQDDLYTKYGVPDDEEKLQQLNKELEEAWSQFEGIKIEKNIVAEDSIVMPGFIGNPAFVSPGLKMEEHGLIHPKRSVFGKTRTRTANDLFKLGLISKHVHRDVRNELPELYIESMVVAYALERIGYYADYGTHKAEQINDLDRMKAAGIISKENYRKLVDSYRDLELKSALDILPYCNQALVVDVTAYPRQPEQAFEKLFYEIKKILPGFDFTNLKVEARENTGYGEERNQVAISFDIDGRHYRNAFSYDFRQKVPGSRFEADTLPRFDNHFYDGINKWLTDINSPQRLHYMEESSKNSALPDRRAFGLIALTLKQVKAWYGEGYEILKPEKDYITTFSTENINRILDEYERIGLFAHLRAEEKAAGKQKVAESRIDSYKSILLCFPKTVFHFDWEMQNTEKPYEEMTRQFADVSRGGFTPSVIKDTYQYAEKSTAIYGFDFKGRPYEVKLEVNSDWFDPDFLRLIKRALEEHHVDGNMYILEEGQYLFLTKAQYEYLEKHQPELVVEQWKE